MKELRLVDAIRGSGTMRRDPRPLGVAGRNAALGALLVLITGGSVAIGAVVGGSLGAAIGFLSHDNPPTTEFVAENPVPVVPPEHARDRKQMSRGVPVMVVDDLERFVVRDDPRPPR